MYFHMSISFASARTVGQMAAKIRLGCPSCVCLTDADGNPGRFGRFKLQKKPLSTSERAEAWRVAAWNLLFWDVLFGVGLAYPIWLARGPRLPFDCWSELLHLAVAYPLLTVRLTTTCERSRCASSIDMPFCAGLLVLHLPQMHALAPAIQAHSQDAPSLQGTRSYLRRLWCVAEAFDAQQTMFFAMARNIFCPDATTCSCSAPN